MSAVTIFVHGAGSCPETARRLLAPAVPRGSAVVALAARGSVDRIVAPIDEGARVAGHRLVLLAGVSLGAHASALWAAGTHSDVPLLLAMPAWTGAPGAVAGLTAAAAHDLEQHGVDGVLDRLRADPLTRDDWVLEELVRGWATYPVADLVAALLEAAVSLAPSAAELGTILAPTAVVALADDPLHPEAVARVWSDAIATSSLAVVGRSAASADRGALGRAGRQALDLLSGSR